MICISVQMAFNMLDEENILDALRIARDKMFRLSSLVATCFEIGELNA